MRSSRSVFLVGTMLGTAAFTALSGGPAMAADAAQAQANAAPSTSAGATTTVQEIVVTGSSIKRVDTEAPSPVQLITNVQLQRSGYDSITDVLSNITANGAGTLSANNSEAFAGGAAGVALRGLSVGDTLTLVDGHRLAPYPLSDDGERAFTDIQSIPFDAVDHVEVLEDGASAIYGSDAIAGVVNIILKKQITGFDALAEGGDSQHGGGATQHYALSLGHGDLDTDGYNAYVSAEYRSQDSISLSQRSYQDWANPNFTGMGGNNLTPGVITPFDNGYPATKQPYVVEPNGTLNFLGSGNCNATKLAAGQCGYTPPMLVESPTQNLNILTSFTKRFDENWSLNVKASFFDSKGQQTMSTPYAVNGWNPSYPGASYAGNVSNPIGGVPQLNVGSIANYTLPQYGGGYLEGVIPQLGLPTINTDSKTYRLVGDLTGNVAGWDVDVALGLTQVSTNLSFSNFVNYDNLGTDLFNGTFNPLGGNSAATMSNIAPRFSYNANDTLNFIEGHASKKIWSGNIGDLSVATGFSAIQRKLENPGAGPILSGEVGGTFSTYAIGDENDYAEYVEVDANLFHQLELNAALRDDYYDTSAGNAVTPKFGFKWRPSKMFALRGTYSEGFRAPTQAEEGLSSTLFGLGTTFPDPILCGNDQGQAKGQVPSSCYEQPGFDQRTNALKPETSKSETVGVILEPIKGWSSTIDFYHIAIKDQIIDAAELSNYSLNDCLRGAALPQAGVSTGNGTTTTAVPNVGPITLCYAGYVNANTTDTSGLDFQTQYRWHVPFDSTITTSLSYTYILNYSLTANGQTYQLAGTHGPSGVSGDTGNPRDHLNIGASFDHGPFDLTANLSRIGSYTVTDPSVTGGADATCQGSLLGSGPVFAGQSSAPSGLCNVKAFTTVNLSASWKFNQHLTFTASIDNLLDANAPIDAQTYAGSFMPYNPSLDEAGVIGRYFRMGVRYKY
jgi:iron complex outermembrane recepter protein